MIESAWNPAFWFSNSPGAEFFKSAFLAAEIVCLELKFLFFLRLWSECIEQV